MTLHRVAAGPLTHDQAQRLTERIRQAVNDLWRLLLEAHDGRAWESMGYDSWTAYIEGEFDMARSHSYRLLHHGRVVRELEAGLSPIGDSLDSVSMPGEGKTRTIHPDLVPELADEVRERVEGGGEPETVVAEVVDDYATRVHDSAVPETCRIRPPEARPEEPYEVPESCRIPSRPLMPDYDESPRPPHVTEEARIRHERARELGRSEPTHSHKMPVQVADLLGVPVDELIADAPKATVESWAAELEWLVIEIKGRLALRSNPS